MGNSIVLNFNEIGPYNKIARYVTIAVSNSN